MSNLRRLRLLQRTQRQAFRLLHREPAEQRLATAADVLGAQVAEWGLGLDDMAEPEEEDVVALPALLARLLPVAARQPWRRATHRLSKAVQFPRGVQFPETKNPRGVVIQKPFRK